MKLIKCRVNEILFITQTASLVKEIEYCPIFLEIPFCVVNSDFVCLDGNKRVKAIKRNIGEDLDILVFQKSETTDLYENYFALNSWRKLSAFEYLFLLKNGFTQTVKGFNTKYCDIVIEKLFKVDSCSLEFIARSDYSMKSLTELFHLNDTKILFVLEAASKFKFSDNELSSVSSWFVHIDGARDIEKIDLSDKKSFFESLYPIVHPFMYRLNSQLKKINTSLPKGVSVLNHDNFETKTKEMRISFTSVEDLTQKMKNIQELIISNDSGIGNRIKNL